MGQLSSGQLSGGNFPREQLSGGQSSRGHCPGSNYPWGNFPGDNCLDTSFFSRQKNNSKRVQASSYYIVKSLKDVIKSCFQKLHLKGIIESCFNKRFEKNNRFS